MPLYLLTAFYFCDIFELHLDDNGKVGEKTDTLQIKRVRP